MNLLTHFRKITILRFVLAGLVLLFLVPALFADGIASRYPNDVGIENDPGVILFDGFESYTSPSQLTSKWNAVGPLANLKIATTTSVGGSKCLEFDIPIVSNEIIDHCDKRLPTPVDTVYVRSYQKWDSNFNLPSCHSGYSITAKFTVTCGGVPPDGSGEVGISLNVNTAGKLLSGEHQPGYMHVYAYWPHQRLNCGDHWYPNGWVKPYNWGDWIKYPAQYPDWVAYPLWQPNRGQWYCFEEMVHLNTPGQNDGVVALWVNGVLKARWPDLFLRNTLSTKIDKVGLRQQGLNSTQVNKKWYDNVVIARSYIGPISH